MTTAPDEVKQEWKDELNAIANLRGWIINSYAQIEFLLGHLVVSAARLPEYADVPRKLPRNLERRADAVMALAESGPYAAYSARLQELIEKLKREDIGDVRHLLVHGLCVFLTTPKGEMGVRFRRFMPAGNGDPASLRSRVFTRSELEDYRSRWVALAQEGLLIFGEMALALNIADVADPAPLGFKNA